MSEKFRNKPASAAQATLTPSIRRGRTGPGDCQSRTKQPMQSQLDPSVQGILLYPFSFWRCLFMMNNEPTPS